MQFGVFPVHEADHHFPLARISDNAHTRLAVLICDKSHLAEKPQIFRAVTCRDTPQNLLQL